ncbi:MAG: S-layer homology domain-containing protein, partial [Actinomycetota bacterium]
MTKAKRWMSVAGVGLVMAVLGGFSAAWASHQFNDVDNGNFFHDSVASIVDAGCATGFADNTFRTNDNATRGQFSFWVRNCAGRAGYSNSPGGATVNDGVNDFFPGPEATVATVNIDVGGATGSGQTQFVTLVGTAYFTTTGTNATYCTATPVPTVCFGQLSVYEGGTLLDQSIV